VVKDSVAHALHILISSLCEILMLIVWLILPAPHAISVEDILDLLTHFLLGTVAEKACLCTAVNDVIRENTGKHGYAFERINISE
jgi:hypothetical protein